LKIILNSIEIEFSDDENEKSLKRANHAAKFATFIESRRQQSKTAIKVSNSIESNQPFSVNSIADRVFQANDAAARQLAVGDKRIELRRQHALKQIDAITENQSISKKLKQNDEMMRINIGNSMYE
jgi:hypothetical protein